MMIMRTIKVSLLSLIFIFFCCCILYLYKFYFDSNFIPKVEISWHLIAIQNEKIKTDLTLKNLNDKEEFSENDIVSSLYNLEKIKDLKEVEISLIKAKNEYDNKINQTKVNTQTFEKYIYFWLVFLILVLCWFFTVLKWYEFIAWIWFIYLAFFVWLIWYTTIWDFEYQHYLKRTLLEQQLSETNIFSESDKYWVLQEKINANLLLVEQLKNLDKIWLKTKLESIKESICYFDWEMKEEYKLLIDKLKKNSLCSLTEEFDQLNTIQITNSEVNIEQNQD